MSISGLVLGLTLSLALTLDKQGHIPTRLTGLPLPEVRWQRGQPDGCGSVAGISSARSGPLWALSISPPQARPNFGGWRPGCRPYPATQPKKPTLNKLINQARFGGDPRTRNGGRLVARLSPCLYSFFSSFRSSLHARSFFASRDPSFYSALLTARSA